jgi:hypothetical protein
MQMRTFIVAALLVVILACRSANKGAQGVVPAEPACAVLGDSSAPEGYFEFQVDRPVRLEHHGSTSASASGRVIAKFVVDTAGRPMAETFTVVMTASPELIAPARAVMAGSRYRPALRHGCRVNQIVMEPYVF